MDLNEHLAKMNKNFEQSLQVKPEAQSVRVPFFLLKVAIPKDLKTRGGGRGAILAGRHQKPLNWIETEKALYPSPATSVLI